MIVQQLPFQSLLLLDKNKGTPIYQQIANGLINTIREGMLQPNFRIPSSRQMAEILEVHRKTVIAAYDELLAQDWIQSMGRKGLVVSNKLPELKPRNFQSKKNVAGYEGAAAFAYKKTTTATPLAMPPKTSYRIVVNDGFPDARIAPVDSLLRHYGSMIKKSYKQGLFMHGDAQGSYNLRQEIASFLARTRAMHLEQENIMVTRGAQTAIFIAAALLIKPGDTVIVGEPNYPFANKVFTHFGAKLLRVAVDQDGIDVDAIEQICKKKKPALLYVVPHHHHPTTVTLSAERRMKLLELIRTYQLPVIEDDYDYDFHYSKSPILPLASASHNGFVMYIGSLTKSFASAIRAGYIIAPADFIQHAAGIKELMDIRGDVLMEEALAMLYKSGEMQKHLAKAVKLYKERRDYFCMLLEKELSYAASFILPMGGMSVWLRFHQNYPLADIARKALTQGILMNDGRFYNTGTENYNALRIGFASMNEPELEELVRGLKQATAKKK